VSTQCNREKSDDDGPRRYAFYRRIQWDIANPAALHITTITSAVGSVGGLGWVGSAPSQYAVDRPAALHRHQSVAINMQRPNSNYNDPEPPEMPLARI